jgi:ribose transport system ATP-binding protein
MRIDMDESDLIFEARKVTKNYPGTRALDAVDFHLRKGEVHALVGENGAGKSTLMLIMAGVLKLDGGSLLLNGKEVVIHDPSHAQHLGISLVFQELALCANMSVAENIFTNIQPVKSLDFVDFEKMNGATRASLEAFGIDLDPAAPLRNYNLATQQIVEIARAIQRNASVLLLDEPTSAIGSRETERLFQVIRSLRDRGVGVVYVSHKLDEVFEISDRITVLKDGMLMGTVVTDQTTPDEIVRMMVGREFDKMFPQAEKADSASLLRLEHLSGSGFTDVSLDANSGEVLGLFGLTGAGRSELARAVFGIDPVTKGEILLDNRPVRIVSPQKAMKLGIAYVPEDRKLDGLFLEMSLQNNVASTNLDQVSQGLMISDRRLASLAGDWIQRLQIRARNLEHLVGYLSGGNQQKVLFGKWLARGPRVLIADEPTRGVDVGAKADIHSLLHDLARKGAAVLMISSELPEVMGLCDRIAVMRAGKIVGVFKGNEATEEQLVAYAAGALSNGNQQNEVQQ